MFFLTAYETIRQPPLPYTIQLPALGYRPSLPPVGRSARVADFRRYPPYPLTPPPTPLHPSGQSLDSQGIINRILMVYN